MSRKACSAATQSRPSCNSTWLSTTRGHRASGAPAMVSSNKLPRRGKLVARQRGPKPGKGDIVNFGCLRQPKFTMSPFPGFGPLWRATSLPRRGSLLEETIAGAPEALWPRVVLSHVLLQEGRDWVAAEQALRDILARDPAHAEARRNLALLQQQQGCAVS